MTADWLSGRELGRLRQTFGVDDYRRAAAGTGVGSAIVVIAEQSHAETVRLLAETAGRPEVSGVVGWLSLDDGNIPDQLAALGDATGLVGMRHSVVSEDADWLDRPVLAPALAELADAGLVLELLVGPAQLPSVTRLATQYPQLTIVVDHLGNPRGPARALGAWAVDIEALAVQPNVFAKMSGLGPLPSTQRLAVTLLALERFGPNRLMTGSDWPVSTLHGDYATVCAGDYGAFDTLTDAQRASLLGGTAARAYGLTE